MGRQGGRQPGVDAWEKAGWLSGGAWPRQLVAVQLPCCRRQLSANCGSHRCAGRAEGALAVLRFSSRIWSPSPPRKGNRQLRGPSPRFSPIPPAPGAVILTQHDTEEV